MPSVLATDLPPTLSDLYEVSNHLYEVSNLKLGYYDLLKVAENTIISVSSEQSKAVEFKTRDQFNSKLWFRMRTGRVTASKFKSVCCTDPASPSLSLIMSICHPEVFRFQTAATSWGCQHEKVALDQYKQQMAHTNFQVFPSGLFISVQYPFLGASLDRVVSCSCCGKGICEVKVISTMKL